MSIAALEIQLRALDEASAPIRKVADEIERLEEIADSASRTGEAIKGIGENLSSRVAAPIVGTLGLATKNAIDFESAMADVNKAFGVAAGSNGALGMQRQIFALSAELGSIPGDVAAIAAETGKLGVAEQQFGDYVRLVTAGATAFDMTADQAGAAFADLTNVMGYFNAQTGAVDIAGLETLADTINYFADNGATSEAAIADVLTRAGGATRQFGLMNNEATALAASFLNLGADSSTVGTAMGGILPLLQNATQGTAKFQGALEQIGLPAAEFEKMIAQDASGAILTFLEAVKQSGDTSIITRMFGQGSDAALLTGLVGNLDAVKSTFEAIEEIEAGSMMATFAERSKTTESALNSFRANMEILSITIGSVLLPTVNNLINAIIPMVQGFAEFARTNPELAQIGVTIALIAAAVGPVLIAIGSMVSGFSALAGAAAFVKTALIAIGAAVGAGLAPILIIVGAIAAAAALLIANWGTARDYFVGAGQAIAAAFAPIMPTLQEMVEAIGQAYQALFQAGAAVVRFIGSLFGFQASISSAGSSLVTLVGFIAQVVAALVRLIAMGATTAARIVAAFMRMVQGAANGATQVVSAITRMGSQVIATIQGLAGQMFSAGANIVRQLASGILSQIGSVVNAAKSVAQAVMSVLPNSPVPSGPLTVLNNPSTGPGGKIVDMLAAGIASQAGQIGNALGGAVSPAASPGSLFPSTSGGGAVSNSNTFQITINVGDGTPEGTVDVLRDRLDELMDRYNAQQARLSYG
ncbi:MAG: phage tail tape measure protein [Cyanobacteria bacterium J06635_1]